MDKEKLAARFARIKVLVVDDEPFMRRIVRGLLLSAGVGTIYDAGDGMAALESIRLNKPDVVILDWEMRGLDGPGFMRLLRSPQDFPYPDVPVIMLSGHSERRRVIEAMQVGVNEFLIKPVSSKTLRERLMAVLVNPRPIVSSDSYYGPVPRKLATAVRVDDKDSIANLAPLK